MNKAFQIYTAVQAIRFIGGHVNRKNRSQPAARMPRWASLVPALWAVGQAETGQSKVEKPD
jgi:hypothetical protein